MAITSVPQIGKKLRWFGPEGAIASTELGDGFLNNICPLGDFLKDGKISLAVWLDFFITLSMDEQQSEESFVS